MKGECEKFLLVGTFNIFFIPNDHGGLLSFLSKISYLVIYDHYSISCCVSNYEKGVVTHPQLYIGKGGEGAGGGGGKGRGGG